MNNPVEMHNAYIVILNWNGWRDTIEGLEPNYKSTYPNFELTVVDNDSTDNSVLKIKGWARKKNIRLKAEINLKGAEGKYPRLPFSPGALTLIETGKNLGFSGGYNEGIKYALSNGADFIFILNNDIVVKEDTLDKLLSSIQTNDRMAAVFPTVLDLNGKIQTPVYVHPPFNFWELLLLTNFLGFLGPYFNYHSALKRKSPYKDYKYDRLIAVPNIVIAAALFRKKFFNDIGLLDDNIFMYCEENILLERLKGTGYFFCFNPFAELIHKGGQDNRKLPPAFLYIEHARSEIYYYHNYMHLQRWQRYLLKSLRSFYYLYCMTKSPTHRKYLPDFIKRYLFWKVPLPKKVDFRGF